MGGPAQPRTSLRSPAALVRLDGLVQNGTADVRELRRIGSGDEDEKWHGRTLLTGAAHCCSGQGCTSNVCHCPELGPDGGVCDCNAPTCGTCPAGWQPAPSQIDLCCRAGGRECFSQSAEVLDRSGGGGRSSGPGACDLYAYKDGHVYDAACDETATPACRCTLDGATTKTFASFDQGCDFGACGFPPWP